MLKLLFRTIGISFYQQHVGLFLVAAYLLFGMIQGYQLIEFHLSLLISICSSAINSLLTLAFWLLYALKCLLFIKQQLNLAEYQFTMLTTTLNKGKQMKLWINVYCLLMLPLLIYAGLMVATMVKHQYYFGLIAIIGLLLLIALAASYTFYTSNYTFKPTRNLINLPKFKLPKPFWTWPLFYLFQQQVILLLVCKLVSILFFKAILWVFTDVGPDIRVYLTALLTVVLSHAMLIYHLLKFDASYQSFAKSLPISAVKRLYGWLALFLLLLLPEFGMLFWLTHFNIVVLLYGILFSLSGLLLMQSLIYILKADMESYFKYLLFFFFISMTAILAGYYFLFSLAILAIAVAFYLFRFNKMDLKEIA